MTFSFKIFTVPTWKTHVMLNYTFLNNVLRPRIMDHSGKLQRTTSYNNYSVVLFCIYRILRVVLFSILFHHFCKHLLYNRIGVARLRNGGRLKYTCRSTIYAIFVENSKSISNNIFHGNGHTCK